MVMRDQRKKGRIQTSARNALEIFTGSSSFRAGNSPFLASHELIKSFNMSWQAGRGLMPHSPREGPSSVAQCERQSQQTAAAVSV